MSLSETSITVDGRTTQADDGPGRDLSFVLEGALRVDPGRSLGDGSRRVLGFGSERALRFGSG